MQEKKQNNLEIKNEKAPKKSVTMANSLMLVMVATLLSKFMGFFREILTSNRLGATRTADIYMYCIMIAVTIFATLFDAIRTTYIPNYTKAQNKGGKKSSLYFTNNILNIVCLVTITLSVIGFILSPTIISVFSRFKAEDYNMAVTILRALFTTIIFQAATNVYVGYLQANGSFFIPGIISLPYNVCIIIPLIFYDKVGLNGLIIGTVLSLVVQPLFLLPFSIKKGYRYSPRLKFNEPNTKNAIFASFPIMLSGAVQQINAVLDKALASSLVAGSIAALNYSNKLMVFVYSLFSISIATIIYPQLSELSVKNKMPEFKKIINKSIGLLNILLIPSSAALVILSTPIIQLLFQHGIFDDNATILTSGTLIYYSIGILFYGYRDILNRAFYSMHDTKTPMINSVFAVALGVVLNLILVKVMNANGLALATSLSAVFATVLLFISFRKKVGSFGAKAIAFSLLKSITATAVMSVVFYFGHEYLSKIIPNPTEFLNQFLILAIVGIAGVLVYVLCLKLFKSEELEWGFDLLKSMIKNKSKKKAD